MRQVGFLLVMLNLDSSDWSCRAIWLDAATRISRIVFQLLAANKSDSRGIKTTNKIIHGFFLSSSPSSSTAQPRHAKELLKAGRMSRQSKKEKKKTSCIQELKDSLTLLPMFFFLALSPWFFKWVLKEGHCHVDTRELRRDVYFDTLQKKTARRKMSRSFWILEIKVYQPESSEEAFYTQVQQQQQQQVLQPNLVLMSLIRLACDVQGASNRLKNENKKKTEQKRS